MSQSIGAPSLVAPCATGAKRARISFMARPTDFLPGSQILPLEPVTHAMVRSGHASANAWATYSAVSAKAVKTSALTLGCPSWSMLRGGGHLLLQRTLQPLELSVVFGVDTRHLGQDVLDDGLIRF